MSCWCCPRFVLLFWGEEAEEEEEEVPLRPPKKNENENEIRTAGRESPGHAALGTATAVRRPGPPDNFFYEIAPVEI